MSFYQIQVDNYQDPQPDPTTLYAWTGLNNENQVYSTITINAPVIINNINIYGGGYGTTAYVYYCVWNLNSGLYWSSGTVTWTDGRKWVQLLGVGVSIPAGQYHIGFWANPSYNRQWSRSSIGTYYTKTATSAVTTTDGGNVYTGALCATIDVSSGYFSVYNGSSWYRGNISVFNGSSYVGAKGAWVFDGTLWKTVI